MDELVQINHIQRGRLQGVLSVDVKGLRTVAQLKDHITALHGLAVEDLLYRGTTVEAERQLKYLIPDFKWISAPRFTVRTSVPDGGSEIVLYVRELCGPTLRLELPAASTVADLTEALSAKLFVYYDRLRIFFKGRQLVAGCSPLTDYGLVSGDNLHWVEHFRGQGRAHRKRKFVDMGNTGALATAELVDAKYTSIPHWEHVCYGLNVRGKCLNPLCEAYGSLVLCHKGFMIFNILETGVHCPACKKSIEGVTCAFAGCQWMFEGRKKLAGAISVDVMSGWAVTDWDECQWFEGDAEEGGYGSWNMAQWSSLIITVRSVPDESSCCCICFEKVELVGGYRAACEHAVHPKCVSEFERAGYTACPTCRNPLSQRADVPCVVLAHNRDILLRLM